MAILPDLSGKSKDELLAIIAGMKTANGGKVTCKRGNSGGMSVYGFGRFPVTLYASQWDKFFANVDHIRAEFDRLRPTLATKED